MSTTPQPPYMGVPMPERFRLVPYDELPAAVRRQIDRYGAATADPPPE